MTEAVEAGKQRQFPCAKCGADAEFVPGQGLKCAFCSHSSGFPQNEDQCIDEFPFEDYVQRSTRGYGPAATKEVKCTQCGAATQSDGARTSLRCAFCGIAMVLEEAHDEDQIRPEAVVPFSVTRQSAIDLFNKWIGGLWFAPNALKKLQEVDRFVGVYRPYWTYDSATHSWYQGERGVYYWVTETYSTTINGRRTMQTRQVRKTRWYPASGQVSGFWDDVLVCAGRPLEWNSKFNLGGLKPYDAGFLAGWQAERYSIPVETGWATARVEIDLGIRGLVTRDIGGDEQRIHSVRTSYNAIKFKHVLLPIWLASYFYHGKTFRFQVNGQTGDVNGQRPWSYVKIFLTVLAVLAAIVGIMALVSAAN